MILLRKSSQNRVVLTLSELANPSVPSNWLFRFVLEQSEEYEYVGFLQEITPINVFSYNLFDIIEGVDFTFPFLGDYLYEVYQMADPNDTNYLNGLLVESGKMRLIDVEQAVPRFENDINYKIYDTNSIS
jgi:hypothetical protein